MNETEKQLAEMVRNIIANPPSIDDILEFTHCKNVAGSGRDYFYLLFGFGGPTVYAEKKPHCRHFHVCACWGDSSYELADIEDSLFHAYEFLFSFDD